jgi:hypothetical protein
MAFAASLLPPPIAKRTTIVPCPCPSRVSFKITRSQLLSQRNLSLNPRCQLVLPNEKIDSTALTASPLQLLKSSSSANSESTLILLSLIFITKFSGLNRASGYFVLITHTQEHVYMFLHVLIIVLMRFLYKGFNADFTQPFFFFFYLGLLSQHETLRM